MRAYETAREIRAFRAAQAKIIVRKRNNMLIVQKNLEGVYQYIPQLSFTISIITNVFIISNLKEQTKCTICQMEFLINEYATELECRHLFHEQCILNWMDTA